MVWKIINENIKPEKYSEENSSIDAEYLNEKFLSIAERLVPEAAINLDESRRILNVVPVLGPDSMMLFEVTEEEIIAEVSRMKPRTSRDIYGFRVVLLKRIITIIVPPLCVL
ncbi:hypothetical protein HHI36_017387, partial [Cryptolaemus montrouzieri]